jgi:Na+-transporting NADH:ubiquinone oxidoreductase subunit C
MSLNSNSYIIGFAAAVCVVCSLFVSGAAVSLKDKQQLNAKLDLQKNIISVAELPESKEISALSVEKIEGLFIKSENPNRIEKLYIDIDTGKIKPVDDAMLEQDKKECSARAKEINKKENTAKLSCRPKYQDIYKVYNGGKFSRYILPVVGKGLWSTLKGFAAVDSTREKVVGLTFYSHGETPGLGGEIDSAKFKGDWASGKKIYNAKGKPALKVAKGKAKNTEHEVDGLSGATLTANGVTGMMSFWFGEYGYQKFLKNGGA